MPLTILTDDDIRKVLISLTREDVMELQQSLADALHYYSTTTDEDSNGCCASMQPMRTVLSRKNGFTTLFMPASSNDNLGVKIVSLEEEARRTGSEPSISSLSLTDKSSASSPNTPSSSTTTFTPPPSVSSFKSTTPRGSLTLMDRAGFMRALINAEELTAFRTALASTMLFKKRHNVHDITVFGAGKQAYWHIRLALLLRGPDVHHVNIINRSFDRAHQLIERLYQPSETPVECPGITSHQAPTDLAHPKFSILTPAHGEYARLLKSYVRGASVLFCTTPSLTPLFPASYLTHTEGRKKGRYIAAIGSYKPHMLELHPDILKQAVQPEHHHRHFHKHAKTGGAVIVDSVEACLREAGEVIQAGLGGHEVVEIGELVMLKRDAEARRRESGGSSASSLDSGGVELKSQHIRFKDANEEPTGEMDETEKGLKEWLDRGNVIYKSVGLGLMDVVVGSELVRLADERGVGTRVENF